MTFKQRDAIAYAISDNDAAKQLQEAKQQLFKTIFGQEQAAWLYGLQDKVLLLFNNPVQYHLRIGIYSLAYWAAKK